MMAGMPVDDELLSAYLDQELHSAELEAVEALLLSDPRWKKRFEEFRKDAKGLRSLASPELREETKELVYRAVTGQFAVGAERRRVPRYRRRWILAAAMVLPCVLTLLYLQNPGKTSRLYLRGNDLVLRSGRSVERDQFESKREWKSGKLWGSHVVGGGASTAFQLEGGEQVHQLVTTTVTYDFNGDGEDDRVERFETVTLDQKKGWERVSPRLKEVAGDFQDFTGGYVVLTITSDGSSDEPILLSGMPGELILPHRDLTDRGR